MLPSHNIATCPLDQILLDFLSSRRSLLARGTPVESLLGPEKPAVKAILYPDLVDSVHTISRVISDIMLTFSTVKLPEKLGFVYKMYHTLRVGCFYNVCEANHFLTVVVYLVANMSKSGHLREDAELATSNTCSNSRTSRRLD